MSSANAMKTQTWHRLALVALALTLSVAVPPPHGADAQGLSQPLNNATSSLAQAHAVGSDTLVLQSGHGSRFGTPTVDAPVRVTVARQTTLVGGQIVPSTARTIYLVTARSSDTLSGLTAVEGTSDQAFAKNDPVASVITAGTIQELQDAIGAVGGMEIGGMIGNSPVVGDLLYVGPAGVLAQAAVTGIVKGTGTGYQAAVAGTDYLVPSGSGAALTGITASQIGSVPAGLLKGSSGAFAAAVAGTDYLTPSGNGSQLTGITQSQVTNLVSDLALKAPLASPAFTGTASLSAAVPILSIKTANSSAGYHRFETAAGAIHYYFEHVVGAAGAQGTLSIKDAQTGRTILSYDPTTTFTSVGLAGAITGALTAGGLLTFQAASSTTPDQPQAKITPAWVVDTHASRTGKVTVSTSGYNGDHEGMHFEDTGTFSQPVIPIANVRDAADDAAAAALTPACPIGGLYRTGSILKIRVN